MRGRLGVATVLAALFLCPPVSVAAQHLQPRFEPARPAAPSLRLQLIGQDTSGTPWHKSEAFRLTFAPAVLIGTGLLVFSEGGLLDRQSVREWRLENFPGYRTRLDDLTRFIPAIAVYGFNLAGVPGRHTVGRATVSFATGSALYLAATFGLKAVTNVTRPDGSSEDSFPSGHTSAAFAAASFLEEEYGYRNRLYSVAGYTLASMTGVMRVLNDRHWTSDVLVGAGIGMLGMRLGYLLVDEWAKSPGRNAKADDFQPSNDRRPHFIDFKVGAARLTGDLSNREGGIFGENGFQFGAEGAYFFSQHVGIGAEWALSSFPLEENNLSLPDSVQQVTEELIVTPTGTQSVYVGPYVDVPLGSHFSLTGKLTVGWSAGVTSSVILKILPQFQSQLGEEVLLRTYTPDDGLGAAARIGLRAHVFSHLSLLLYGEYNVSNHDFSVTNSSIDPNGTIAPLPEGTLQDVQLDYASVGLALSVMAW